MKMNNISSQLNQAQKKAVIHKDGPLLLSAGCGVGKTTTIAHRIHNLISNGISPSSILLVTFTRKAADEMRFKESVKLTV